MLLLKNIIKRINIGYWISCLYNYCTNPNKEIDNELGNFDFNNESYWFRLYFKCRA